MLMYHPEFSVQPRSDAPDERSLAFVLRAGQILLKDGRLPLLRELSLPQDFRPFHLARVGGCDIFSPHPYSGPAIPETEGTAYQPAQSFRQMEPQEGCVLTDCLHLWNWYQAHRFCGCCGSPAMPDDKERALRCTACGHLLFPVICPAVITAITCGSKILLARNIQSTWRRPGLIAGYVEVGETLEHAVRREAMEEVGLEVKNIRYIGDQPWGISGSHMFAFAAEADDTVPIRLQQDELSEAVWTDRSELPQPDKIISVAAALIERFRTNTL